MKSKRGSSAIFLSVILAALVSITMTLIYAEHETNIKSRADAVFNMAGQSVMSEYNKEILDDYDLFLIKGSDKILSDKFSAYAGYSLDREYLVRFTDCKVSTCRFSVMNSENIRKQIINSYNYWKVSELLEKNSRDTDSTQSSKRHLRHGPTIDSLPSSQLPAKGLIADVEKFAGNLSNPSAIFNEGTARFKLDSYILNHFNSELNMENKNHFFANEVEYILVGKMSDEENLKAVNRGLMALFIAENMKHIYASPEKSAAVELLSQTITPGVLGTVTQAGITAAWATAEASNDIKLLHEGMKVPLNKDELSWATDLDGVITGYGEEYIKPKVNRGLDYTEYLRILLFFRDEELKTNRILDLIQINMRKDYDSTFLICEYGVGIGIEAVINGQQMAYDHTY